MMKHDKSITKGSTAVPAVPPGILPGADARVSPIHRAGPMLRHRVGHPAEQAGRLYSPPAMAVLAFYLAAALRLSAAADPLAPTLILVQGAPGEAMYAEGFSSQIKSWQSAAAKVNAEVRTIGEAGSATPGRALLEKTLTDLPKDGAAGVWIVMIGHGTWDGKEARFNLEGPDLSATDLAAWLKPVQRPVVVINTASSSAPFMPVLAGPNRTIITATRSGNERNYARFGQFLAASLDDPAADYDQDGRLSLLEWFLRAGSRTSEFYLAEGRIQTEHALIDDNDDGKGTPVEWFRGLRATTKTKDKTPLDGTRAHQRSLAPDPSSQKMTPEQLAERDKLEAEINALREKKGSLAEDDFYRQLETLFRQLAALYGGT